jgi:hypothetical protein
MTYVFTDKIVYCNNKRQMNKFRNQQDERKITFNKNSDEVGCVEIYVNFMSNFDKFVEYMFRKLGKDIIPCIGTKCDNFEELKKMNVSIPEKHKKMWEEKDKSDYKLIELLNRYDIYYMYGQDEDSKLDKLYKECMEEKISEYRGKEENNNKQFLRYYICIIRKFP